MRRRTIATVAAGAAASVVAGGVALAQSAPGFGPGRGGPMGGGMSGLGGMMGMGGMMGGRAAPQGQAPGMMGGMMGASAEADRWFIEEMIPHHEDAVVMADLALAQAEHAELKTLAQQIKTTQSQEIAQMRAWYLAWYGTADIPNGAMEQMHESMAPMMAMMHRMMHGTNAAGPMAGMGAMHADPMSIDGAKPFDKAFIEHMIPHHQMAVMMATHALAGAQKPEMQTLLQSIITSQSAEIRQMQTWHHAWYPSP